MSMTIVPMQVSTVQALIKHNKVEIRSLETEKKYLQHIIQLYWNSSNPLEPSGVVSATAFFCMNKAKGDLAAVKKRLKLLAEVQYSLKYSIR